MNYLNKIVSRIEQGKTIIINFNIDEFIKRGTQATASGLIHDGKKWQVQIYCSGVPGGIEEISLTDYMDKTKDIK